MQDCIWLSTKSTQGSCRLGWPKFQVCIWTHISFSKTVTMYQLQISDWWVNMKTFKKKLNSQPIWKLISFPSPFQNSITFPSLEKSFINASSELFMIFHDCRSPALPLLYIDIYSPFCGHSPGQWCRTWCNRNYPSQLLSPGMY